MEWLFQFLYFDKCLGHLSLCRVLWVSEWVVSLTFAAVHVAERIIISSFTLDHKSLSSLSKTSMT